MMSNTNRFNFRVWDGEIMHNVSELMFLVGGIRWHGPGVGEGWATSNTATVTKDSTIMQSTGLTDKNGVEIYEGDVTDFGIIVWDDGSFCVDCGNEHQRTTCICQDRVRRFTVIGNIHENPNMLKG